jgi:hypothetical protein
MPERGNVYRPSFLDRVARIAYTFVVMNWSAVMGVIAALRKQKVWH